MHLKQTALSSLDTRVWPDRLHKGMPIVVARWERNSKEKHADVHYVSYFVCVRSSQISLRTSTCNYIVFNRTIVCYFIYVHLLL